MHHHRRLETAVLVKRLCEILNRDPELPAQEFVGGVFVRILKPLLLDTSSTRTVKNDLSGSVTSCNRRPRPSRWRKVRPLRLSSI